MVIFTVLMKTLYLVRHAKSSWDDPGLGDLKRPLSKRGKRDAPFMGRLLNEQGELPGLIVSSPAKRAYGTARRIAKEINYPVKNIIKDEALYMADNDDFLKVIHSVPDSVERLMLFGHNYGITYFANYISGSSIGNIPTCGAVRIDFEAGLWKEINVNKGQLIFFEYPKKHRTKSSAGI